MIYYAIILETGKRYPFPSSHWASYFARLKRKEGFTVVVTRETC